MNLGRPFPCLFEGLPMEESFRVVPSGFGDRFVVKGFGKMMALKYELRKSDQIQEWRTTVV